GDFWDWLIGHKEGSLKPKGLLDAPWKKRETWSDSRQGAISKLWDSITGNETKDIEARKERNAEMERKNLETREDLINRETLLRSDEERNLLASGSSVRNSSLSGQDR